MQGRFFQEVMCPNLRHMRSERRRGKPTPHGVVSQIPTEYRQLPIVSAIRNPFDTMVSLYHYADWKREDVWPASLESIRKHFPTFPELEFTKFLSYSGYFNKYNLVDIGGELRSIGPLSKNFLMFFSKRPIDPEKIPVYKSLTELFETIAVVRFLRTERISDELEALLLEHGYWKGDTRFIRKMPKENTSERSSTATYFPEDTRKRFAKKEWLIFEFYNAICQRSE